MSDLMRANLKAALLAGIAMAVTAVPAAAGDLRLALPVACEIARDCFVQNFFDHDPGPERRDYACGSLSYDGHTGTDFRVADIPAMTRGVTVVAAAGGTVKAVRDGMPDVGLAGTSREALNGREAGNGVVIDHGDGWETQYSHLSKGSTLVRPGQTVEAGTPLGRIGMSGQAEFPHVELAVRHEGEAIDPFTGSAGSVGSVGCGETGNTLWRAEAMAVLKYQPTGGLVSGFAAGPAVSEDARKGAYAQQTLKDPPALVFWADVFGVQTGDEQRMSIAAPGGKVIHETTSTLKSGKVSWFAFSGRKRPAEGWQAGTYRGTYTLLRNGAVVARLEDSVELQ
ncbi:MAG TPA: M23 family metallopeptidase [Skermanella sp.]|jgi:murein DD-endopeptidase MepM/ murein hydrolase activator NlpD|nr:M23 family metallopeptidase [Skermanella sp.]